MSFDKHRQKIRPNILFISHKTLPMFISGQMIGFCMQKGKLNWKFFPPLFALNYLQIIICKLFANKNYLQINLPSVVNTGYIYTHSTS